VYRPPTCTRENNDKLCDLIKGVEPFSYVIGDFNMPTADWEEMEARGQFKNIMEACEEKELVQLVDFTTHLRGNKLDLVLTNQQNTIRSVTDKGRLGTSDHVMIEIEVEMKASYKNDLGQVRNWKRADWAEIKKGLRDQEWPRTEDELSTEQAWTILRRTIDRLVEKHVPMTRLRPYDTPWMSGDILREIRRKRRLWKRAKGGDPEAKARYLEAEKKVRNLVKNAKRGLERGLAREKDKNSKPFYRYVSSRTKTRCPVGPLKNEEGEVISDDTEMAEHINEFFCTVFTRRPERPGSRGTKSTQQAEKGDGNEREGQEKD